MSTDISPQSVDPGDAGKPTRAPATGQAQRPRRKPALPGVDEILVQLLQLNGAVLMGTMSAKQADLIHKNLRTVLQVQVQKAASADSGPVSQEGLAEVCRKDPKVLNAIEPFLSQQQLEALMNEVTDDHDEPV